MYIIGLMWHTGQWDGKPPTITQMEKDERNIGVAKARTMSIIFIVFAELQRGVLGFERIGLVWFGLLV